MAKLVGWLAFGAGNSLLLWQLSLDEPNVPRLITASLLILGNLIVGIRLGDSAASSYLKDAGRLNRYLADQNRELTECNYELLAQLAEEQKDEKDAVEDEPDAAKPGRRGIH